MIEPMPWEPEDNQQEEIQNLHQRMSSLESAMHQIVQLLAQERMNPATVNEFPDVPEVEAWNDPWDP